MRRLTPVFLLLAGALVLGGCSSMAKDLGEAGAFEQATCYDEQGRQWTGTAACQDLARAQGYAKAEEAKASLVASIRPPTSADPLAWDRYYDAVEDGPMKAAIPSSNQPSEAPASDPQANLAHATLVTASQEKQAWIHAGSRLATGGLGAVADIVQSRYSWKKDREMWAAFSRPSVSVGLPGGGGGGVANGEGTFNAESASQYIVNVDGAVATDNSRANNNRDGWQANAYDDGAATAARNVTDPTYVNGVCDDGESLCDGATAPFVQQQNPTSVEPNLFPGR